MFVRGAMAGAKIVRVVCIDAVSDGAEIAGTCQSFHAIEEFVLAVVAAVGIVRNVKRILEFVRLDKLVANSGFAHEFFGLLAIVA